MDFNSVVPELIKKCDFGNHSQSAEQIWQGLYDQSPGTYNVIVYDAITGWQKHGESGCWPFFRSEGAKGEANVVVMAYDSVQSYPHEVWMAITKYLQYRVNIKMDKSAWEKIWDEVKDIPTGWLGLIKQIVGAADGQVSDRVNDILAQISNTDTIEGFVNDWCSDWPSIPLFVCKRYQGVYAYGNCGDNLIWEVGDYYTMASLVKTE